MYVEIMASRSNVVLVAVDAQGVETVAACAYQVRENKRNKVFSSTDLAGKRIETAVHAGSLLVWDLIWTRIGPKVVF